MIARCPACGCEIFNGITIKSHETYTDCFAALDMEQESTNRRRKHIEKLMMADRRRLEAELRKVYELDGS